MGKYPTPKGGGLPSKKSGSVMLNRNVLSGEKHKAGVLERETSVIQTEKNTARPRAAAMKVKK